MATTFAKASHDLVIRNGTVIDGTGGPPVEADVAVTDGTIRAVGSVAARGREEVDARDLLVTPGFIDIHTHYDGQATWDRRLVPSSWHGVTTAVMGNCGVGFAPVRPQDHERLLALMEGVEDIPGPVLREGVQWRWESFGDYLDALDAMPRDINVCAQLAHGPVRIFVMGDRATAFEPATAQDVAAMRDLVAAAIRQGAFGFSTTRTLNHRSATGENTPTYRARKDELVGIAAGMAGAGRGVFQFISDWGGEGLASEFDLLRDIARASGGPVSFSLGQMHDRPDEWRHLLALTEEAVRDGLRIKAQVAPRSIAVLQGLQSSISFFSGCPSYDALGDMPLREKLAAMRAPGFRERLLAEDRADPASPIAQRLVSGRFVYPLGTPPDYEPPQDASLMAIARRTGRTIAEVAYDHLTAGDGGNLLFAPINNYAGENLDACEAMLGHERTLMGLGDGGAHVSFISDASFTTYLLSHWTRDRRRGRFPLEWAIKRLTSDNARFLGIPARGELRPGMQADINLIDYDALGSARPYIALDLPFGGKRLLQNATGYRRTMVAGRTIYIDGEPTAELPGRLLRSGS